MGLNVIESGNGPPVALLHGLLGSARNWGRVVKGLASAGRRTLAIDLPNHGASPTMAPCGYARMAAEVAAALAGNDAVPADIIGHSMGGKVAMMLALAHPAFVRRMVVADIAPVPYRHSFAAYVEAMRQAPLDGATRRAEIDAYLSECIPDARVRAFLMQNLESRDGGFRWRPDLDALAESMTAIAGFDPPAGARWDGPALFVTGALSDYLRPEHQAIILDLFPEAEFARIEGAGHWVHADRPEEFLAIVEDWL